MFEFSLVEYVVLVGIGIPPFAEVAFSFSFLGECRKTTRVVLSGRNNDFFTAILLPAPHSGLKDHFLTLHKKSTKILVQK